jgi:dihydrodipicolinate synthase/N-acetylneuraminate lyase
MNRDSVDWHGPMPAVTTPFTHTGAIDEYAFAANIDRLLDDGATGIVAGGCTGEFWALSFDERVRLTAVAREAMAGRGALIVCSGAITAEETIALTRAIAGAGADGVLVLPPYFVRLTDDEIVAHFETVGRSAMVPVMLYNIPGNAGNVLTPALVARLAEIDTVVAVKESSGDWNAFHGTLLAAGSSIRVFCGPSSLFGVPAVLAGADGTIDCFPNVWSPGGLDLYYAAERGDLATAWALQALGQRLTELFTTEGRTLYPATKAAMDLLNYPGGGMPRAPLQALSAEQTDAIAVGLQELGLMDRVRQTVAAE